MGHVERLGRSVSLVLVAFLSSAAAEPEPERASPDKAMRELVAGNRRYVAGKARHPGQKAPRRQQVATGQHPIAIVVSCSDSRVPPELLFDQGLGDLFVVRSAGHVVDDVGLASIEYAAEHLGASLVVVLGHERCGAVKATVDGGTLPGHLGSLTAAIAPAVAACASVTGDKLDAAVRANVELTASKLRHAEPIVSEAVEAGHLKIVGARYDLDTGVVEILPDPAPAEAGH